MAPDPRDDEGNCVVCGHPLDVDGNGHDEECRLLVR